MHLDRLMSIRVHLMVDIFQRKCFVIDFFSSILSNIVLYRIGIWDTNGVPITNNVIYNTYQSAIVVTGQNNIIQNNLVSTIYWSGNAQPQYAPFNLNFDAAIMSTDAVSVVMTVRDFCSMLSKY